MVVDRRYWSAPGEFDWFAFVASHPCDDKSRKDGALELDWLVCGAESFNGSASLADERIEDFAVWRTASSVRG